MQTGLMHCEFNEPLMVRKEQQLRKPSLSSA